MPDIPDIPVQIPDGWRELLPGEIIKSGDRVFPRGKPNWNNVRLSINKAYKGNANLHPKSIVVRRGNEESHDDILPKAENIYLKRGLLKPQKPQNKFIPKIECHLSVFVQIKSLR